MKIFWIAWKDLGQIARDRKSAVFLLALPVLFTLLLGAVFGANAEDPRLPVGLVAAEGEAAGGYLRRLLEASEAVRPVRLEADALRDPDTAIRQGGLAALVEVPESYNDAARRGETPALRVWLREGSLGGQAADRAVQLAATRLLGAYHAARIADETADGTGAEFHPRDAVEDGITQWEHPQIAFRTRYSGEEQGSAPAGSESGDLQASAGMMVFFMLLGALTPGAVLLAERRQRTLPRLRAAGVTSLEILLGHLAAMFVVGFAQILLLSAFGSWTAGVDYWRDPAGMLALAAGMALFSSAFGLSLGAWTRSENQAMLFAMGITFVLGIFGGCFFPLELTDLGFAAIGRMLPSAWALDSLRQLALRPAGEAALAPALIGLSVLASAMIALSAWWLARTAEGAGG